MEAVLTIIGSSFRSVVVQIERTCDDPVNLGHQIKLTKWKSIYGEIIIPVVFPLANEFSNGEESCLPKVHFHHVQDTLRTNGWITGDENLSSFAQNIQLTTNSLSKIQSLI